MLPKSTRNAVWSKTLYPDSMFHLPARVRKKAIDIGNSLICEKNMEGINREVTAIMRAKEWAVHLGLKTELKVKRSTFSHKRNRKTYAC